MGYEKPRGVFPAVFTPFRDDGKIDFNAFQKHIKYLCDEGVNGLFLNGTTSESVYLKTSQKKDLILSAREVAGKNVMIFTAAIRPGTDEVIEEMNELAKLQPDYLVAVTPFYFSVDDRGILMHYKRISDAVDTPVLLYNIPQLTHNPLKLEIILELAESEKIMGIKDSSGNFSEFSWGLIDRSVESFSWIQGEDTLDGPSLLIGADGIVTGLGNVWIKPYVDMWRAAEEKKWDSIIEEQKKINALYRILKVSKGKIIAAIKAGSGFLGRGSEKMVLPGTEVDNDTLKEIEKIIRSLEFINT